MSRHPLVNWAQRLDKIFLTVELPDAKNVNLQVDSKGKILFSANVGPDNTKYEIDLDLYDKIDPNKTKVSSTSRNVCYLLKKAERKWWSRLLKLEGKPPSFLKVDWDKWVDEDELDGQDDGGDHDVGYFDFLKDPEHPWSCEHCCGGHDEGEDDENDTGPAAVTFGSYHFDSSNRV